MTLTFEEDWFRYISERATLRQFDVGQTIFMQGEPSDYVGYIISGRAKAIAYSQKGDATWIGYFESKEFFGHISFLTNTSTKFEVIADETISALIMKPNVLQEALNENVGLNKVLTIDMATRLDFMTSRLIEAYTLSAKGRICAELVRLSDVIGITPEKTLIRPNPVFVDLALRVNSTRETVSRTVNELQKKGVLSRAPGALIVEHPERLLAAIK